MKRLFAAIKIHPSREFLSFYRELRGVLEFESIKWVEENNLHLTLKFFGETEEKYLPLIQKTLEKCAGEMGSFELCLTDLGLFGSTYAPRVIHCGLEPHETMLELMKQLKEDLALAGFEADRQNLVPHLTLGRIKVLKDKHFFKQTLTRYRTVPFTPEKIREIILFESILRREGPQYSVVQSFPFKK
ncbi:MAG: RNA 2',3'-cyclic phosphodiesterase [Bacteroidales bacterium]|nr:RNA 2',3'-cyclic phosphodiesterase [Bacteroidales bacterium]